MMSELTLYTSNRLDVLVARLAQVMAESPLPPLEREIFVTQSQGMQRWLTLQLAARHGIAGGLTTPFPRPFCHWLARRVLDGEDLPATEAISEHRAGLFDRETLTWRLFQKLSHLLGSESGGGTDLEASNAYLAYLQEDPDQRKRFQFSSRLAALFDDYQMFRPDMLGGWELETGPVLSNPESSSERWQSQLWRDLIGPMDGAQISPTDAPLHRRLKQLIDVLAADEPPRGLPSRVSVVGISSLPPIFIDLLAALARHLPVAIYFVSPTYHYWGDLRSDRETARLARRMKLRPDQLLEERHFEQGHALLAALGRQGRDFFNLLQQADETGGAWQEVEFEEPGDDHALHLLQHDILHLIDRGSADSADYPRLPLDPADRSIEIHACHSPLREMEVLRDRLLDAVARDPDLRPGDILVQVPDIELYGPYIQAVFGVDHDSTPRLPFSIADRRAGREQPPSEIFLDILDLVGSRLTVRQVFDLLDTPAIRRRFELAVDELPTLRRLVEDVRIRWAKDGRQKRAEFDLPEWDANTWRAGLDRLLMGYAVGSSSRLEETLPAGIAPFAGDTAGVADAVGRFATYVERLFHVLRVLSRERSLDDWVDVTLTAVDELFAAESEAEERGLQWIRDEINKLAGLQTNLDLQEPISPRVIRDHLASVLHASGFGSGFIDGRITFCALKPMRTIPFRVVCIAGLNDGAFPRQDVRRTFDLIAATPRAGDRSLRDDDRYLFLETLLAAQDRLILSFVGRSQKDSSQREPSVVLAELMDQIDRSFFPADGSDRPARELLWVEHRLQPWSPAYFRTHVEPSTHEPSTDEPSTQEPSPMHVDDRLRSFSQEDARAAQALSTPRHDVPRFTDGELPGLEDALLESHGPVELEVRIDELRRFWRLPCRHFSQGSLGVRLPDETEAEAESEPFLIDGLEAFEIRQWMLARRIGRRHLPGEDGHHGLQDGSEHGPDPNSGSAHGRDDMPLAAVEALEMEMLRAQGRLPAQGIGLHQMRRQSRRVEAFLDTLPAFRSAPPLAIDLHIPDDELGFRLTGLITHGALDEAGHLSQIQNLRCGEIRPQDLLDTWIELLVVCRHADMQGLPQASALLVGESQTLRLEPPIDVDTRLEEILHGYRKGLGRALPFFPGPSHAFAEQSLKLADPRNPARLSEQDKARAVFEGRGGPDGARKRRPDCEDPYVRLAFRGMDPIDDPDFSLWSKRIWLPILATTREVPR